jgi:hypothetical protein
MITEEQIIEILKSYSNYTDRSRTDECVHKSNFDLIAKELVKKLTIPDVIECVQFDADEIIAFLNDCETLDEAKMFADEHLR